MRSDPTQYALIAPPTLAEALQTLAQNPTRYTPIAGGTELMVALSAGRLPQKHLLSINHLRNSASSTSLPECNHPRLRHHLHRHPQALHHRERLPAPHARPQAGPAPSPTRTAARWAATSSTPRPPPTPRPRCSSTTPPSPSSPLAARAPCPTATSTSATRKTVLAPTNSSSASPSNAASPATALHPQGGHPQRPGHLQSRPRVPRALEKAPSPDIRIGAASLRETPTRCTAAEQTLLNQPITPEVAPHHRRRPRRPRQRSPPHRRHPLHRQVPRRRRRQPAGGIPPQPLAQLAEQLAPPNPIPRSYPHPTRRPRVHCRRASHSSSRAPASPRNCINSANRIRRKVSRNAAPPRIRRRRHFARPHQRAQMIGRHRRLIARHQHHAFCRIPKPRPTPIRIEDSPCLPPTASFTTATASPRSHCSLESRLIRAPAPPPPAHSQPRAQYAPRAPAAFRRPVDYDKLLRLAEPRRSSRRQHHGSNHFAAPSAHCACR
jgi:hypothetical protein